MKRLGVYILFLLLLILGLQGCKSSKSAVGDSQKEKTIKEEQVLREIASSYNEWRTFTTSGKINISGIASFSTSVQLKMQRDKSIMFSIRPVLGIEVARLYVNNDSAVIVNKLHKVYTSIDLKDYTNIVPVSVGALQDVFLSRVFSLKDGTLSQGNIKKFIIEPTVNGYIIALRKNHDKFTYDFTLNSNKVLETLNIRPKNSKDTYVARYSDYTVTSLGGVASGIEINTEVGEKSLSVGLSLNTSKIKWNEPVEDGITIGNGYRKVTMTEFLKILKSI